MKYIQLSLTTNPCNENITDVLAYQLGDIGYDSFIATPTGLEAYIPQSDFSEEKLKELASNLLIDAEIIYEFKTIEDKDWNKEWEKNYFNPLSTLR